MNYAIQILETERKQLETILNHWELSHYPEARKERDNRLNDIKQALELLKGKAQKTLF